MSKKLLGCLLAVLNSCSADDSQQAQLPRMATSQQMQVVLALVSRYRADEAMASSYTKQKPEEMPIWSHMLPLHVLRTNDSETKHPLFLGFAVPLKALVSYTGKNTQAFALQDSAQLFQQVSNTEILLDSTVLTPGNLLTPHLYEKVEVRRKVHGYGFYRFSQPLFSPDGNLAYIQVDEAGSRKSYRLAKENGKWTITSEILFWVV
jgi:hypothetical protein